MGVASSGGFVMHIFVCFKFLFYGLSMGGLQSHLWWHEGREILYVQFWECWE